MCDGRATVHVKPHISLFLLHSYRVVYHLLRRRLRPPPTAAFFSPACFLPQGYIFIGPCGNQMGTKLRRWCATRTASAAAASTAATAMRISAASTRLPRGLGRQVRVPRGAIRPRARRDRRCNTKSPLGELFSPDNLVNQEHWDKGHYERV
jgi:hypothetical protein